jgi:hypothetical protein
LVGNYITAIIFAKKGKQFMAHTKCKLFLPDCEDSECQKTEPSAPPASPDIYPSLEGEYIRRWKEKDIIYPSLEGEYIRRWKEKEKKLRVIHTII